MKGRGRGSLLLFCLFSFLFLLLGVSCEESKDSCENDNKFGGYFSTREGEWGDTEKFEEEMIKFVERQQKLLETPKRSKFIVFQPVHTGLGNRLEGMVSTFLIAYLTGRGFLVNFDHYDPKTRLPRIHMIEDEILDEPFPWQYDLLTSNVNSEYVEKNSVGIELRGGRNSFDEPFVEVLSCGDMKDYLNKQAQYVMIKGNKYFGQLIANNPLYSEKLSQLFRPGIRRNMFASLLGFLLRPKQKLIEEAASFITRHKHKDEKNNYILGVQTRTTEKFADAENLPIYNECAELGLAEGREKERKGEGEGLVFLSTDDISMRGLLHRRFGDDLIFHEDELIDMRSSAGRYRTTVWHGMKDILTLAMSDDMVVTCGSSFSRIAIGLARKPATVVSAAKKYCQQHVPLTCSKTTSIEPCCYLWYELSMKQSSCFNSKIEFQEMAICGNM
uniref:Fucosyltransferase n=1 Tax=Paramoeba aestuarina TaxID=180227 RepID=A0A7S4N652_9EUKA|mmetsp:Transcript_11436/g.17296  ORF Transcript_11436/g.17296 Transcript_11436/m.17296 type:complete len:444 (+) Transcript_11436:44-1375(+)